MEMVDWGVQYNEVWQCLCREKACEMMGDGLTSWWDTPPSDQVARGETITFETMPVHSGTNHKTKQKTYLLEDIK